MDKRYQVFVSSTFADLQDERRAVIQTLMEMDCIPAGMELFPAADEEQMDFIKKVIDDCDYYLLIIGGRYGSVSESGISYTEQEYDYAIEKGLKVIALVHGAPDTIARLHTEKSEVGQQKLDAFRARVQERRLVHKWANASELPGIVALSLQKTIKSHPGIGWVRGNAVGSQELLSEINELRKQNLHLTEQLNAMRAPDVPHIENLAGLDEIFSLSIHYETRGAGATRLYIIKKSWKEYFLLLAPFLGQYPTDNEVGIILGRALSADGAFNIFIDLQVIKTLSLQYQALGLITCEVDKPEEKKMQYSHWKLTPVGHHLMMQERTVKSGVSKAQD